MNNKSNKVKVQLRNVTAKYVYVYERNKDGIYSMAVLINKEDKDNLDKIKKAFNEMFTKIGKKSKTCLEDGDTRDWEGYEGNYFINLNQHAKIEAFIPKLIGSDGVTNLREDNTFEDIKSNDTVNVNIEFWFSANHNKILASFDAVQFVKMGERYVEPSKSDEFEPVTPKAAPVPANKPDFSKAKPVSNSVKDDFDDLSDIFNE